MQRRTLRVLASAQLLGGLGLAAGVAVGALLARDLGGSDSLAGIPSALATGGGALAALPISRLMARAGRRPGLLTGYATGAVGALGVVLAASVRSFPLLLLAMAAFGVGNTASLLARYAAADLASATARGRAVSTVLFATTFGAVAGPNLAEPMGGLARAGGLPTLAGPFLLSMGAYVAAALVVSTLLRPDPLLLARERAAQAGHPGAGADALASPVGVAGAGAPVGPAGAAAPDAPAGPADADAAVGAAAPDPPAGAAGTAPHPARSMAAAAAPERGPSSTWPLLLRGPALAGLCAMVAAQFVMVAMMTMTPVHMRAHEHGLRVVGVVISAHVAGMYALSPVGGVLVDRLGAPATLRLGAVTLLSAGLLGALASPSSVVALTVALFLLGLGWSLSLVGGSTLLTVALPLERRAEGQGNADLLVGLAGASGGLGSGLVLALSGYAALGLLTAAVATGLLAASRRQRPVVGAT